MFGFRKSTSSVPARAAQALDGDFSEHELNALGAQINRTMARMAMPSSAP